VYLSFVIFIRELDHAMLRRLEKRILVDLPTEEAREAMFKHHLPPLITPESHGLDLRAEIDYKLLAGVSQVVIKSSNILLHKNK